jgi:CRP-like cAMP-binding protein
VSFTKQPQSTNHLLAALPKKEYQRLQPHFKETALVFDETVYEPNVAISDVYFPTSGIISLLAGDKERSSLEVGLVGREGMVGLPVFMGVGHSLNRAVVQGSGIAWKMKAATFRTECSNGGSLPEVLRRYTHSMLTQVTQAAVCNQFHAVAGRLARWLLMTHDRMGKDEFQITQQFLSNMLGVRREGVSIAAGDLQRRKLIRYKRGVLKVLDRSGLETVSCPCYRIIKDENDSNGGA